MQMKYKTKGNFENMYPKTIANNVEFNNKISLEEWKKEVEDSANVVEDNIKTLQEKVEQKFDNYKERR